MLTLSKTKTQSTINPTTGEEIREFELLDQEATMQIIDRTYKAYLTWSRTDIQQRGKLLASFGNILRSHKDELARLMTQEMGKTLNESLQEVELCAQLCDYTAQNGPKMLENEERELDGGRSLVSYRPQGIIFGIQPWNFPMYQALRYTIPNLMGGNVVLLKHAANVWGTAMRIEELILEAGFPKNVFRHLCIDHETAEAVMAHKWVRGITFTGSSSAGTKIAEIAARNLKKTVLELGSNDAYLILADAKLEETVEACMLGRFNNAGQTCVAAKRFIVVDDIYDRFKTAFIGAIKDFSYGDPELESTKMGPMARKDLRATLHEQVEASVKKGARLVCGGEIPDGKGFFYPATVLENVKPGMPAYDEELFGPVASLIRAKDTNDAIRIANDSRFGLGGGIFSANETLATDIALNELDTGMVNVNGYHLAQPHLPFGGVKDSGYGREHGGFGIHEFMNIKSVMIKG